MSNRFTGLGIEANRILRGLGMDSPVRNVRMDAGDLRVKRGPRQPCSRVGSPGLSRARGGGRGLQGWVRGVTTPHTPGLVCPPVWPRLLRTGPWGQDELCVGRAWRRAALGSAWRGQGLITSGF